MPGQTATASNITVSLQDTFSDTVNITLAINILTDLFRQNFTDLNVTAGTSVSVDVKTFLWDPSDVDLELSNEPADSWLKLESSSLVISGTTPSVQDALDNAVTVTATSKSTKQKETRTIKIHIDPSDIVSTNTGMPAPTATATTEAHTADSTAKPPSIGHTPLFASGPVDCSNCSVHMPPAQES
ncbi:hypothetical protein PG997_006105 [Apiospora hydei]|uniref:Uncharacterized protein n=1 Tax=Apiospora hydei TaxID=1337664 RepID=A0ABR1WMR9_9PEZI